MKHSDLIALNGFVVVISFIYGFYRFAEVWKRGGEYKCIPKWAFLRFLLLSSEKVKNLKDVQILFLGCYTLHVIR